MAFIHVFHYDNDGDVVMDGGELVWVEDGAAYLSETNEDDDEDEEDDEDDEGGNE